MTEAAASGAPPQTDPKSTFRRASPKGPKLVRSGSGEFGAILARTGSGSSAASRRSGSGGFGEGGLDSFCDLVSQTDV